MEDFKPIHARRRPYAHRASLSEALPAVVLAPGRHRHVSAISGIEQACWDILGKALGVPVYKLLGGAVRDKVRMYTHLGGGDMRSVYESFDAGPRDRSGAAGGGARLYRREGRLRAILRTADGRAVREKVRRA